MNQDRDDKFLVRFICESDAIEQIGDDPATIGRQIKRRNVRGHVGALLLLRKRALQKARLTPELVKQTQSLIVSEQHKKGDRKITKKHRGNWRDCDVWIVKRKDGKVVEEIKMIPPAHVPSLMAALIEKTAGWQRECLALPPSERVLAIARFHYDYLRIHPFADGNGRSGRALVYYLYHFADLDPFVFPAQDRHKTYYPCFRAPDATAMNAYFQERTRLVDS